MLKRLLVVVAIYACAGAWPSPGLALDLDAQLFPLTGELQLRNTGATDVPFVYFSVRSNDMTSGALNSSPAVWKSISDNYDVSGNGFIDPVEDWIKFSATSTQLTEGVFFGPGGSLAATRSVSFGTIWNPGVVPYSNLAFDIREPSGASITVNVQQALAGDYFPDGTVNLVDYSIWRQNIGSSTNLNADGNLNGIIDAADYSIWRDNYGNFLPGFGLGQSHGGGGMGLLMGGAVPEPSALAMGLLALAGMLMLTRSFPGHRCQRASAPVHRDSTRSNTAR